MKKIRIASAIITNSNKDLLVVRKHNSSFYMLPGGKIAADETFEDTLIRELKEELALDLDAKDFRFLGTHETRAANEADTIVQGNIFHFNEPLDTHVTHHAELAEVVWITKENYTDYQLAYLLKEFALPTWLADFK